MKQQNEFKPQQQQQLPSELHAAQTAQEFASAEDLLRFDTKQVTVPPAIAERLQKSTQNLPAPNRSWWQRFFGGNR